MQTILTVFGTRPEAVKMAPVIKALRQHPDAFRTVVCSTGQHREMLNQILDLFQITPDYNLDVMRPDQSLAESTANILRALDGVVQQTQPDWMLAQGDTTTVLVASLIAFYRRIRFGHVEAGLRTGDKYSPFPEEMNRRIADILADVYFAPTEHSRKLLLKEGVADEAIHVTGNTVVDALLDVAATSYDWEQGELSGLPRDKRLVLVTAHRRESFGEPFRQLCTAISELAQQFAADTHFVYPVHLNPNVQQPVREILSGLANISLIEPLGYFPLVHLMKRSVLVLTDSGGIQEEAPTFGVPVLVMRDKTERFEGIEAGVARIVGTKRERIVAEAARVLQNPQVHAASPDKNPYGDGKAAGRIVQVLLEKSR